MAVGRGKYIDQSQSLNIHISDPNYSKLTSMHFYAWKNGLKTGMYYLRTKPAVDAIKFTLNVEELLKATDKNNTTEILKIINKYEHSEEEEKLNHKDSSNGVVINGVNGKNSSNGIIELSKKDSIIKNEKYQKKEKEDEEGCINCSS